MKEACQDEKQGLSGMCESLPGATGSCLCCGVRNGVDASKFYCHASVVFVEQLLQFIHFISLKRAGRENFGVLCGGLLGRGKSYITVVFGAGQTGGLELVGHPRRWPCY